jgi:integrase
MYYLHDTETGQRASLGTKDKARATELLVAHNEAAREPAFNLQKARVYLAASDPEVATRTWRKALNTLVESKRAGSANRQRWAVFVKDKAIKALLDLVILETRTDHLLGAVVRGKVSTNVYLRRLQNFCIGMNWLPWPILPPRMWPPIKFKKKRAIKQDEHLKIVAREGNEERRKFYELLWELGGAQTDIACLEAEDVDWSDSTLCYSRKKLAGLDETDIKPPLIKFGKRCAAILRSLPQTGPLFPYLRTVDCKDRATEFKQRCKGLGIEGVTLHSYRYAWAERARKAHYPRRQAEEALGHNSKAVHIAYAKRAQVTVDSLEDYEEAAAKKVVHVEFAGKDSALPAARP